MLALAEGFAGYSLPDDLLSGTGLRIAQGIMMSIPVVGTYASRFAFGGQFPGHLENSDGIQEPPGRPRGRPTGGALS